MIQNFDITNQISSAVTFSTETLTVDDYKCYIVYDTSTGATTLEDYYSWRATTYTSTGLTDAAGLTISNSNLYPKLSASISDSQFLHRKKVSRKALFNTERECLISLILATSLLFFSSSNWSFVFPNFTIFIFQPHQLLAFLTFFRQLVLFNLIIL